MSVGVRDLAGGATSADAKETAAIIAQLQAWVYGQMTAVMQITDTDIAFRAKSKLHQLHERMKQDLMKLAEAENTDLVQVRPV